MKTFSFVKATCLQITMPLVAMALAVPAPDVELFDQGEVVLPAGWAYIGCFTDQTSPGRTLTTQVTTLSGSDTSIETCIAACAGLGFLFAGTFRFDDTNV